MSKVIPFRHPAEVSITWRDVALTFAYLGLLFGLSGALWGLGLLLTKTVVQ